MKNKYEIRGEVTAIFLHRRNGEFLETLINTTDLERAKEFPNTWCACWSSDTQSFYCYGKINIAGKRVSVLLHRWLVNISENVQIDHYDNDTLNNRRMENLRIVKHAENHQNRADAQRNSKTGIRGVCWYKRHQKWQALVKVKQKRKHLGYFESLEDAEIAVKEARRDFMPFSKEAICV